MVRVDRSGVTVFLEGTLRKAGFVGFVGSDWSFVREGAGVDEGRCRVGDEVGADKDGYIRGFRSSTVFRSRGCDTVGGFWS